jgi:hypothetical protein
MTVLMTVDVTMTALVMIVSMCWCVDVLMIVLMTALMTVDVSMCW